MNPKSIAGIILFTALYIPVVFHFFSNFSTFYTSSSSSSSSSSFLVMSSSVVQSSSLAAAAASASAAASKTMSPRIDIVLDRIRGSLWGILIGDSLAMPAHWYYDTNLLKKTFGKIESYLPAPNHIRGSIMNLSNTK